MSFLLNLALALLLMVSSLVAGFMFRGHLTCKFVKESDVFESPVTRLNPGDDTSDTSPAMVRWSRAGRLIQFSISLTLTTQSKNATLSLPMMNCPAQDNERYISGSGTSKHGAFCMIKPGFKSNVILDVSGLGPDQMNEFFILGHMII